MKHKRSGFTLVEVTLFLAVSGLLLLGVLSMTQASITSQRFNDVTQNFAEFLRKVYSDVANPQGIGDGRSEKAIYGRMITFGEKVDLSGKDVPSNEQKIFVYDVVGSANGIGTGNAATMLAGVGANVIITRTVDGVEVKELAGIVEEYTPRWGAVIDSVVNGEPYSAQEPNGGLTILIVRHPRSGMVSTLVYDGAIEVNAAFRNSAVVGKTLDEFLTSKLSSFKMQTVNFCMNTEGFGLKSDNRSNVRVVENARNSSGVEIVALDGDDNVCRGK